MAKFKVFYILYSIFNIYVENKKDAKSHKKFVIIAS